MLLEFENRGFWVKWTLAELSWLCLTLSGWYGAADGNFHGAAALLQQLLCHWQALNLASARQPLAMRGSGINLNVVLLNQSSVK